MTKPILYLTVAISTILFSCSKKTIPEPSGKLQSAKTLAAAKKVYIPKVIWNIPTNNDYNNDASLYSNMRRAESDDFVAFWAKDFGATPATNTDPNKRFDIVQILKECERFFQYYADTLKFVTKGRSVSDTLKALIYVTNSTDGTAYGGGAENKVGILWVPLPVSIRSLSVLLHTSWVMFFNIMCMQMAVGDIPALHREAMANLYLK